MSEPSPDIDLSGIDGAGAVALLSEHWDGCADRVRGAVHAYCTGTDRSEATERALLSCMLLLGEKADTASHEDICVLACDVDLTDLVFGEDHTAAMLPPVLVSTFDGDMAPLQRLILAPTADPALRAEAVLVLAYLLRTKRIGQVELYGYLAGLPARFGDDEGAPWSGWAQAVAMLGFAGLSSAVETAFRDGRIDGNIWSPAEFWDTLRAAQDGDDSFWAEMGPAGSAVDALGAMGLLEDGEDQEAYEPAEPVRNPLRSIGRNDPCPCGSGRKYKKCCLPA